MFLDKRDRILNMHVLKIDFVKKGSKIFCIKADIVVKIQHSYPVLAKNTSTVDWTWKEV